VKRELPLWGSLMYWVGRGCRGSGQMCVMRAARSIFVFRQLSLLQSHLFPRHVTQMMELEKLKDWIGQRETDIDYVTVPAVHRLSAKFH
jgi:hypothetical protein